MAIMNGHNQDDVILKSNILVVGAGGIGCEILKNLTLSGFKNIEVIDLDTIDVSNLNRQFLFRQEHIGKSKSAVAKDSITEFTSNITITSYHDSIFNTDYGLNFFKRFNIVLNALDNRSARNHVNRLCLAADIALIESGTSGYSGQVEVIKKGISQCYECQPKPPQRSFPGCTIRNTPSEPVHCIVWAKHLFNQLFGEDDPDQDVSPDNADPELANSETPTNNDINKRKSTRQWAVEINYDPQQLFEKFFNDDIKYLLSMETLWKSRKPPTPLSWSTAIQSNETDTTVSSSEDMVVLPIKRYAEIFAETISSLKSRTDNDFLIWDKDDPVAMDFVAACANIRASIFSIAQKSKFAIKSIAGNIIPAIATANALIAGLVVLYAFKTLREELCPSVYLRQKSVHSKILIAVDNSVESPNPDCYVCASKPVVDLFLNVNKMTVKEFETEVLKNLLNMIAPDAYICGKGVVVISSEEGETTANEPKVLSEVGVVDGCILKVDDFLQNYELTVNINHYEPSNKEDPSVKLVANKNDLVAKNSEETDISQDGGDQEATTSKKRKLNPVESDDEDLIIMDDVEMD